MITRRQCLANDLQIAFTILFCLVLVVLLFTSAACWAVWIWEAL
ncbi:hypothetical protein [Cohaesibacter marisflavi]|nr:hypothetical protein [Cohaesibacter marisflavi]